MTAIRLTIDFTVSGPDALSHHEIASTVIDTIDRISQDGAWPDYLRVSLGRSESSVVVVPDNLQQFAYACIGKTNDQIHDLFEACPEHLRNRIYSFYDPQSPEPLRSAFEAIGLEFSVEELVNY